MAQSVRRRLHPDRAEFSASSRIIFSIAAPGVASRWRLRGWHTGGIREWTAGARQNRPMLALLRGLRLPLTLVTGQEMVFARLDLAPMASFVLPSA